MIKDLSIMKKIDQFILDGIENLKDSSKYKGIEELYSTLDDDKQILVKVLAIISFLLIPLLILFACYSYHSSLEEDLNLRVKVYQKSTTLITQNSEHKSTTRRFLGDYYSTQSIFKNILSSELKKSNINTNNIQYSNFNMTDISDTLQETTTTLKIAGFSNDQLFNFLKVLTDSLKAKIEKVSINKNISSNLLDGVIDITHLSQIEIPENE